MGVRGVSYSLERVFLEGEHLYLPPKTPKPQSKSAFLHGSVGVPKTGRFSPVRAKKR